MVSGSRRYDSGAGMTLSMAVVVALVLIMRKRRIDSHRTEHNQHPEPLVPVEVVFLWEHDHVDHYRKELSSGRDRRPAEGRRTNGGGWQVSIGSGVRLRNAVCGIARLASVERW